MKQPVVVHSRAGQPAPPAPAEQETLVSSATPPSLPVVSSRDAEFLQIVERHQAAVFAYFRARLIQATDAEDFTQEVFVRYYKGQAKFHGEQDQRPFLLGVARNLLRERARKLKRRNEVAFTELCLEVEENGPEPPGRYEQYLVWLPRCLEKLSDSARLALKLHYREKQRYEQIAKVLRRTIGAVKLLMFRARQSLKKCLDKAAQRESSS